MRHGRLVLVLSFLIFFGCTHKLKISPCLIDPPQSRLDCSDYYGNKFTLTLTQADNYVCFEPNDLRSIYENCRRHGVRVGVCVFDATTSLLECSNGVSNSWQIPILNAENYICFSPGDTRTIFEYCAKKVN